MPPSLQQVQLYASQTERRLAQLRAYIRTEVRALWCDLNERKDVAAANQRIAQILDSTAP